MREGGLEICRKRPDIFILVAVFVRAFRWSGAEVRGAEKYQKSKCVSFLVGSFTFAACCSITSRNGAPHVVAAWRAHRSHLDCACRGRCGTRGRYDSEHVNR